MGLIIDRQFHKGDPVAAVPSSFYSKVDEVLTFLDVFNGHIERNNMKWTIVFDKGENYDTAAGGGPHRFRPQASDTAAGAVTVDAGGWNVNGTLIVDTGGTAGIGSSGAPYIIATITHGTSKPLVPTAITVSAAAAAAADSDFTKVRTLAKINHDTSGAVSSINRYQVGDVYQPLAAIQDTAGNWSDGGKTGATREVLADVRWNDTAAQFEKKMCAIEVINGTEYIHQPDTGWTNVVTFSACP